MYPPKKKGNISSNSSQKRSTFDPLIGFQTLTEVRDICQNLTTQQEETIYLSHDLTEKVHGLLEHFETFLLSYQNLLDENRFLAEDNRNFQGMFSL